MRQSLFWQSVIDTSKEIVPSQRDVYQEALSFGALFPALLASAEALRVINRLKAKIRIVFSPSSYTRAPKTITISNLCVPTT
jgi:hypothetical protein